MDRYIVIRAIGMDEFQKELTIVAQQGYTLHSYKHIVVDEERRNTWHHFSAVMELEPVEFDAMAFQKQHFGSINN